MSRRGFEELSAEERNEVVSAVLAADSESARDQILATLERPAGEAEILTGDCVQVLAGMSDQMWDHVITDPPYAQPLKTKRGAVAVGLDYAPGCDLRAVAREIARRTRRWAIVWCGQEEAHEWREAMIYEGMDYIRTIWYARLAPAPQLTGDRPAQPGEVAIVCHAHGERLRWNAGGKSGLYVCGRDSDGGEWHDTPKPRALCESLIRDFTDPGESVLDLFAGSGAIGKAALRLGRSYTGIEIREDWAERARQDLAQIRQSEFTAAGRPRQEKLL